MNDRRHRAQLGDAPLGQAPPPHFFEVLDAFQTKAGAATGRDGERPLPGVVFPVFFEEGGAPMMPPAPQYREISRGPVCSLDNDRKERAKRPSKDRAKKFPVPFLTNLAHMCTDWPDLIEFREGNVVIYDSTILELLLAAAQQRALLSNSRYHFLPQFEFTKVEYPYSTINVYTRVNGRKITTINDLLMLRPRERRKSKRSRDTSAAELDVPRRPPDHRLAVPLDVVQQQTQAPISRQIYFDQPHHPWVGALRWHDTTNEPRGMSPPNPSQQMLQQPPLEQPMPGNPHLQEMFYSQMQRAHDYHQQWQHQPSHEHHLAAQPDFAAPEQFAVQLQHQQLAVTAPSHREGDHNNLVSFSHSTHPIDDDDGGLRPDEFLVSMPSSSAKDFPVRARATRSFFQSELKDAETLLSLSGTDKPQIVAPSDDYESDDAPPYGQSDRLCCARPPNSVAASSITKQHQPSTTSRPSTPAAFPQPPQTKENMAAAISPRAVSRASHPTNHQLVRPTDFRSLPYEAGVIEHERDTAFAQSLGMRADLDDIFCCVICLNKPRVFFLPECRHFVLCLSCANKQPDARVICPHCRYSFVLTTDIHPL